MSEKEKLEWEAQAEEDEETNFAKVVSAAVKYEHDSSSSNVASVKKFYYGTALSPGPTAKVGVLCCGAGEKTRVQVSNFSLCLENGEQDE